MDRRYLQQLHGLHGIHSRFLQKQQDVRKFSTRVHHTHLDCWCSTRLRFNMSQTQNRVCIKRIPSTHMISQASPTPTKAYWQRTHGQVSCQYDIPFQFYTSLLADDEKIVEKQYIHIYTSHVYSVECFNHSSFIKIWFETLKLDNA